MIFTVDPSVDVTPKFDSNSAQVAGEISAQYSECVYRPEPLPFGSFAGVDH
ncbi:hypothetical protein EV580_6701 [Mycobacterium sp. BK086]|nr:hypothetical protein EV580_6701 [Mycobacterium sp. BK086]